MAAHPALATRDQYLAGEQAATIRHEFVDGHIYAMSGASRNHVEITANLHFALRKALETGDCRNLDQDTKVWIEAANAYFYPDATVSCPPHFVDDANGVIDNPRAVFEVLSASSFALDEGPKFRVYRQLPSLRDYVLIDSRRRHVRVFSLEEGEWLVREFSEAPRAPIPSLDIGLDLDEIYRHAQLSTEA